MNRLRAWAADHVRAGLGALGRLSRTRLASGMTAAVLGIALALPTVFMLLLQNIENAAGDWDRGTRISLFLGVGLDEPAYRAMADELAGHARIRHTRVITPEEALEEFRTLGRMEATLELLDDNPLPPLIVVTPQAELPAADLEHLLDELRGYEGVEQARLDLEWVQRLQAIMELVRRGIWLVAVLLALTVVLVVGNTTRLAIENRREEIVIAKLIGATNAFIRRPFLYEGIWYGLGGGVLAVVLVEAGRAALVGPARELSRLYDAGPLLQGLGAGGIGWVLLCGMLLGLLGSWLAVGRHLSAVEPR
ncbi:MAG: ABC transporter permease [Ectothiorhodospiraceae bacterium]|nr:ABC transporter permease [Ectothiorhodospiraceae bacterium]